MAVVAPGTLISVGAAIFLSLFGILIKILHDISTNVAEMQGTLDKINTNLYTKLDSVNDELTRIEQNTSDTNQLLARMDERTKDKESDGGTVVPDSSSSTQLCTLSY